MKSLDLKTVQETHCAWLKEMGWVGNTTPLEQLALIASEIGEAVNECRGTKVSDQLGAELADIVLRTVGMASELNIDLSYEIEEKIKKNLARGNKGRIK
jgi:NTP pyrophosphatase (non-canonical NTP hydrolase)